MGNTSYEGLPSLGNTCFLNAVIQVFRNLNQATKNIIMKENETLFKCLYVEKDVRKAHKLLFEKSPGEAISVSTTFTSITELLNNN